MSTLSRFALGAVVAAALAALLPSPAPAAENGKQGEWVLVTLKDGTVIQGKVNREGTDEVVPEDKVLIFIPNGFFYLDDQPRRVYFNPSMMDRIVPRGAGEGEVKFISPGRFAISGDPIPPLLDADAGPGERWDAKWNREITYQTTRKPGSLKIRQHLGILSSYHVRTDAMHTYAWPSSFLTRELDPKTVWDLVNWYYETQVDRLKEDEEKKAKEEKRDPKDLTADIAKIGAAHRQKAADFFAQAGWFDEADRELKLWERETKGEADKAVIDAARKGVAAWRAREQFAAIKRLDKAGRHERAQELLKDFKAAEADPQTQIDFGTFQSDFDAKNNSVEEAIRFLNELPKAKGQRSKTLAEAAAAIAEEVLANRDVEANKIDRLEAFLVAARQAQRQKAGCTPPASPDELLSLAVIGWMKGLAFKEPAEAERVWRGRRFVLSYQRAARGDRSRLLEDYLKQPDAVTMDDLIQLIPNLPPPEPGEIDTTKAVEVKANAAGARKAPRYLLKLPPEYRHGRSYPVLIVLHKGGEKPEEMIKRWEGDAGANGYILAAPEWEIAKGGAYGYTPEEHTTVLATLRDLRQHYNVDSDRVFLFGLEQGGAMAYDVGLSHPDLFAGVLPMSAGPDKFAERYWRNGQYLPFYIVDGDRCGDPNKLIRETFKEWLSHGSPSLQTYPMLWVQYKGRGVEWFGGELSNMFDWMNRQKRAFPLQELGKEGGGRTELKDEFTSHRNTDNSFYWLSCDGIALNSQVEPSSFTKSRQPAAMTARIDPAKNEIWVRTYGVDQTTIWLSNDKGAPMINFDKPLIVNLNGKSGVFKDTVTPNMTTLLDGLCERGDKQRLFVAKVELPRVK
jgi:pimeloyl-ACP methyl ester carboxylesterase